MRKKIGYVNVDSEDLKQMAECAHSAELREGIRKLASGEYSSLMLEADPEGAVGPLDDRIVCGALSVSERSREVLMDGKAVLLTPKEFDILLFLIKNRGEVFTKEQIYKAVWADDYVMDDSNIMAFIRKLRKKIEVNPDAPEYILTIWGIGYKFNDRV